MPQSEKPITSNELLQRQIDDLRARIAVIEREVRNSFLTLEHRIKGETRG